MKFRVSEQKISNRVAFTLTVHTKELNNKRRKQTICSIHLKITSHIILSTIRISPHFAICQQKESDKTHLFSKHKAVWHYFKSSSATNSSIVQLNSLDISLRFFKLGDI